MEKISNQMVKIVKKINYVNVIIFCFSLLIIFLIDWLTKYFLFDSNAVNDPNWIPIEQDYGLFGIRSLAHGNTTLFSFLKINTSPGLRSTLNFILIILFTIWAIFSKTKFQAISLGIIVGGMFGNAMDVVVTEGTVLSNYVRDILYLPWLDRGTFNFADTFIVCGSILLFISIILMLWKDNNKNKKATEKETK